MSLEDELADELDQIVERLQELADYATDLGVIGTVHKIEEVLGPLGSAREAAIQAGRAKN